MTAADGTQIATPKKRTAKGASTRSRILKAARAEFATYGLAGARTERISLRARSNPRMLYHYFGGKSDLYVAVLEDALSELRRTELMIDVEHLAPLDGLIQLFDFMSRHFETNIHLVRLLTNENIEKARYLKMSQRAREMSSPVLEMVADLLARGESAGELRAGLDPLEVYVMMVALNQFHLSNFHTLTVMFDRDVGSAAWRASQHAVARAMVRAYLRREPGWNT